MKTMKKQLVAIDFDGTMADTHLTIIEAARMTVDMLDVPHRATDDEIRKSIGLPSEALFRDVCGIRDPKEVEAAIGLFRANYRKIGNSKTVLYPGVRETLTKLRDAGVTLAVASSRFKDSLMTMLRYFELTDFFTVIVGDDDVAHAKPAPDMVLKILAETGIAASEALTVGDTQFDILMGQRAGTDTCGVTYGNHTRQMLQQVHATHIIDHFSDLLHIVLD